MLTNQTTDLVSSAVELDGTPKTIYVNGVLGGARLALTLAATSDGVYQIIDTLFPADRKIIDAKGFLKVNLSGSGPQTTITVIII